MLRQAFEAHGEVVDAFVAYNGRSSRGFGYVTYKEIGPAATAVAVMNGVPLTTGASTNDPGQQPPPARPSFRRRLPAGTTALPGLPIGRVQLCTVEAEQPR